MSEENRVFNKGSFDVEIRFPRELSNLLKIIREFSSNQFVRIFVSENAFMISEMIDQNNINVQYKIEKDKQSDENIFECQKEASQDYVCVAVRIEPLNLFLSTATTDEQVVIHFNSNEDHKSIALTRVKYPTRKSKTNVEIQNKSSLNTEEVKDNDGVYGGFNLNDDDDDDDDDDVVALAEDIIVSDDANDTSRYTINIPIISDGCLDSTDKHILGRVEEVCIACIQMTSNTAQSFFGNMDLICNLVSNDCIDKAGAFNQYVYLTFDQMNIEEKITQSVCIGFQNDDEVLMEQGQNTYMFPKANCYLYWNSDDEVSIPKKKRKVEKGNTTKTSVMEHDSLMEDDVETIDKKWKTTKKYTNSKLITSWDLVNKKKLYFLARKLKKVKKIISVAYEHPINFSLGKYVQLMANFGKGVMLTVIFCDDIDLSKYEKNSNE